MQLEIDRPGEYSMRAKNAHAHNDDHESTGTTVFGFWIYLMTDAMLFATIFVTYAVGHGPDRSAFLSGFFTLVGTHGLHVASGLVWIGVMAAQVAAHGFSEAIMRRMMCLSLFWHFLDVVWICVFSIAYLLGVILNV